MSTQKTRVCPRCGSPDIREAASTVGGWLIPPTFYCETEDCGYSGSIYVEVNSNEVEHLQMVINSEKKREPIS